MATGAPGTNGVWQYGEDDSEATFSALLNKVASTTDTQIGTDRGRLTTLEARKLSGLIPIIPTSVSISGGTATTSSTGAVTFSAGTTGVTLNNVFTTAYRNYVMVFSGIKSATSGNDAVNYRLTANGTPEAINYNQAAVAFASSNGAAQNLGGNGATALYAARIYGGNSYFSGSINIYQPKEAATTKFVGMSYGTTLGDDQQVITSGVNTGPYSFDGIRLYPTANTISGVIAFYGLED